jgi:hypothetical protein
MFRGAGRHGVDGIPRPAGCANSGPERVVRPRLFGACSPAGEPGLSFPMLFPFRESPLGRSYGPLRRGSRSKEPDHGRKGESDSPGI